MKFILILYILRTVLNVSKTSTPSDNKYNHHLLNPTTKLEQDFNFLVTELDWPNSPIFLDIIKADHDTVKQPLIQLQEFYINILDFENLNFDRKSNVPRKTGELFFTQESFSEFYIMIRPIKEAIITRLRWLFEAALLCN